MKTSLIYLAQSCLSQWQIKWCHFLCFLATLLIFPDSFANQMLPISGNGVRTNYTASIERVWADHNQIQNGQKGVIIHVAFDADNSRGRQCSVVAYFHYGSGQPLKDQNGEYVSSVGTVSTIDRFTPNYDNSHYSDYPLFIPYAELHIEGSHQIMYYVMVRTGDGRSARSANFYFNLNWGSKSREEMGSLICAIDCPKDGFPCSEFSVRLIGDDDTQRMQVNSSGQANFNNLPPGNYKVIIAFDGDSKKGDDITAKIPRFSRPTQWVSIVSGQRSSIRFE
jgi:hypothetical protein